MFNYSLTPIKPSAFALLATFLLTAFTGHQALASGGGGGYSGGGGGIGPAPAPREVDQVYEYGKSVYLGRSPGSKKISYCVKVDGELKKLRGRNLKSYRGAKQLDFANALYNCKAPDELALAGVDKEEIAYVIYYLNKRYKLDLAGARS